MSFSPRSFQKFQCIALAREVESPENPGGLEKRVALTPRDVGALVKMGLDVFVEHGAGDGVGFYDDEYVAEGANLEAAADIYCNKDLIIKFKGPSMAAVKEMRAGTTLFCMAHFHSFPERAKLLEERKINVIAMEEILESPKVQSDEDILSRVAMTDALQPFIENNTIGGLRVRVISWSARLTAAIHRAGNRDPRSLRVIHDNLTFDQLDTVGDNALYVYDSLNFADAHGILPKLKDAGTHLYDIAAFEAEKGAAAIADYRKEHLAHKFGMRRIQCLHETGMAGARYGLELLRQNKPDLDITKAKVIVLGYGNVGRGAIHELYDQGVSEIAVLGRTQTTKGRIDFWLQDVDLVVNGADQAIELRGKNYLISKDHVKNLIPDGSVIIDLVGGSKTNRSPVEPVLECTYLTDPMFVVDGVSISALWGWPMMGMMRETAIRYSGQILSVLTGPEWMLAGLDKLTPGVERALVCGPFETD
jgi:alanine dehydrogenase